MHQTDKTIIKKTHNRTMDPTDEQLQIFHFVRNDHRHAIIDAVAGSGKTTTIIESTRHVQHGKTMMFCAFNRSIAKEIKKKFTQMGQGHFKVKTLHALGFDILKSNNDREHNFDENKYPKLLKEILNGEEFSEELNGLFGINDIPRFPESKFETTQQRNYLYHFRDKLLDINTKYRLTLNDGTFQKFKGMLLHFNIFNERKSKNTNFDQEVRLYMKCNKVLLENGNELAMKVKKVDYTDMLYLPNHLNLKPITLYDILFVDECQDLSWAQIRIALKYVKKEGRIIAVGDPYQSIYGFTGADIESFDRFKKLTGIQPLTLTKCFRCPANIIDLAQKYREDIHAHDQRQGQIESIEFDDVAERVGPTNLVISRTKAPLQKLLFILVDNNIEVEVHEDEVKEFINDLRFLFSNEELTDVRALINDPGFFENVIQRNIYIIEKKSKDLGNLLEREEFIREGTDMIESKVNFIQRQLNIHNECKSIDSLMKVVEKLISGGDNAVRLSTIHRAKGLEGKVIFILNYDKLPLSRDGQKEWEKIQERNLIYVALTRSKNTLYLVNSEPDEMTEESLFDDLGDNFNY